MRKGHLSVYFEGVAFKKLSAVEANPKKSNQHEFNGVSRLKKIFGKSKQKFNAQFLYLGETEENFQSDTGIVTWYDARERHPIRSEYRLYFQTTAVSELAAEDDLLVIGKRPGSGVLVIVAQKNTTAENQLKWLFGIPPDPAEHFNVREITDDKESKLNFAAGFILKEIGIEVGEADDTYLERMIYEFGGTFPTSRIFSAFARSTLEDVSPLDDPDGALIVWLEREEILFKTLEKYIVGEQLKRGFERNVDLFINFSLSVQNRRKSRAGLALENHIEKIFSDFRIKFSRGKITENKTRPDFIFPSIENYHDPTFPLSKLNMLGAKSTCKDRWRQVLSEADRVGKKHLLTLEPGISENQTEEMKSKNLKLVIPSEIHKTYLKAQNDWLLDVRTFLSLVKSKQ